MTMDLVKIISQNLIGESHEGDYVSTASDELFQLIKKNELKILDLVQGLNPVLTNASYQIRLKGVQTLVKVVTAYGKNCPLNEKEVEVINEFLCLKLIDHKTMERPVLECISYFVELDKKPKEYNKTLLDFLKTKINIRKMESMNRHLVYQILHKVVLERRRESSSIDTDMVYSLIHLIEGENDPSNLLLCFSTVSYTLKNFQNLEPYIDDFFEWLTAYYPIDYTPNDKDIEAGVKIMKNDLVESLYDCFYSNDLNSENLQTLLIEKLDSNLLSTKLESLRCLIRCYQVFPHKSIKDYASSLWTVVRMDCLKKKELVDAKLLQTSHQALSALSHKLAEDDDTYFTFITDIYEELAIAFRKPEMDLFEPAAQLLTNAAHPKPKGFNFLLSKILPVAINAFASNELRPLAGLAYIFEQLLLKHPESKLDPELDELLDKLACLVCDHVRESSDSLRLLNSLFRFRIKLNNQTMNKMIEKFLGEISERTMVIGQDVEESLALICLNYNRLDILFGGDNQHDCNIISLMKLINVYNSNMIESKFSVYLRLLILLLNNSSTSELDNLDQLELNKFLSETRHIAQPLGENQKLVGNIARIHAIIINKLNEHNLTEVVMDIFKSDYCQKFVPKTENERQQTSQVYFPVLKWVLKSLIVRNHKMFEPVINLILNFITSGQVDQDLALEIGFRAFKFIHLNEDPILCYRKEQNYRVFSLYRQKFYSYTKKEIQIRHQKESDKKVVLVCLIAAQIPHLPQAIYRQDYEWLLRQILSCFNTLLHQERNACQHSISIIYDCLDVMIENDSSSDMLSLLESFIKVNLSCGREAKHLQVRSRALRCLAAMPLVYNGAEALNCRTEVLRGLKPCLSDKKRLVRVSAAHARLNWFLLGQPIGSQ